MHDRHVYRAPRKKLQYRRPAGHRLGHVAHARGFLRKDTSEVAETPQLDGVVYQHAGGFNEARSPLGRDHALP